MDLTNMASDDEEDEDQSACSKNVKRKIADELDNVVKASVEREVMEKSPFSDPLHHNNRDPAPVTTPLPSRVDEIVCPEPKRPQINPLDSPATRTRLAMRKLITKDAQNCLEENVVEVNNTKESDPKKTRGKTKMQTIAVEPEMRLNVTFNEYGQPVGETSVGLASFLGSLVREVVPVTVETWKKLSTRQKEVLWHSIRARSNIDEEWQKKYLFQKMSQLWRASKSRLVSKIGHASNDEELNKLKPDNVSSMHDWNDFIKDKTSAKFKKNSSSSTPITRVDVWTKAHLKKDGKPINSQVPDTLERIEQNRVEMSHSGSIVEDAISRVLGSDRGHVRGLAFGVTRSKLSTSSQKDKIIASLERKCNNLTSNVDELKSVVATLLKDKEKISEQNSHNTTVRVPPSTNAPAPILNSPPSVTTNTPHKCLMLDWVDSGEIVAEGRWFSSDPSILVTTYLLAQTQFVYGLI